MKLYIKSICTISQKLGTQGLYQLLKVNMACTEQGGLQKNSNKMDIGKKSLVFKGIIHQYSLPYMGS